MAQVSDPENFSTNLAQTGTPIQILTYITNHLPVETLREIFRYPYTGLFDVTSAIHSVLCRISNDNDYPLSFADIKAILEHFHAELFITTSHIDIRMTDADVSEVRMLVNFCLQLLIDSGRWSAGEPDHALDSLLLDILLAIDYGCDCGDFLVELLQKGVVPTGCVGNFLLRDNYWSEGTAAAVRNIAMYAPEKFLSCQRILKLFIADTKGSSWDPIDSPDHDGIFSTWQVLCLPALTDHIVTKTIVTDSLSIRCYGFDFDANTKYFAQCLAMHFDAYNRKYEDIVQTIEGILGTIYVALGSDS